MIKFKNFENWEKVVKQSEYSICRKVTDNSKEYFFALTENGAVVGYFNAQKGYGEIYPYDWTVNWLPLGGYETIDY